MAMVTSRVSKREIQPSFSANSIRSEMYKKKNLFLIFSNMIENVFSIFKIKTVQFVYRGHSNKFGYIISRGEKSFAIHFNDVLLHTYV